MNPVEYLAELEAWLVASPTVASFTIIDERTLPESGYFRARLRLSNGDFVEQAEYFAYEESSCRTTSYRYQWMNDARTRLRRRWDNVEHFPDLLNALHHVHYGDQNAVLPGEPISALEVLRIIEHEILEQS